MATKKKARKVRLRTSIRKLVLRIRKAEESMLFSSGDPDYWYKVCRQLSLGDLRMASDYLENQKDSYSYRIQLFEAMQEALATVLLEKSIGLEDM